MENSTAKNKVLVLALSGIGNFLMQLPFLKLLKQAHPDWHVTVAVAPRGTKELAEHSSYIDTVLEISLKQSLREHRSLLSAMRREKFYMAFMLSPGQLLKGSLFMFLSHIPIRIGHAYPFFLRKNSSFLLTHSIREVKDMHDIDQNIQLLSLLNSATPQQLNYEVSIPLAHQKDGHDLMAELKIPRDKPLVGFHVGSAKGFQWKRWPVQNFITVGQELLRQKNIHILVFGDKNEHALKETIQAALGADCTVVEHSSLLTTGAVIQTCKLFLSNDSGLMHLASALGVETYGLFGPTNEKQTGPRGIKSHVIRAAGTNPEYNTEKKFNLGLETHESLRALQPTEVLNQVITRL